MREIKFRAWNGRSMCYGGFSIHCTGGFVSDEFERVLAGFKEESPAVMQYTGLKDKNGVEIYEGDILKNPKYGVKIVDDIRNIFKTNSAVYDCIAYSEKPESKIIGNIYQNPELLDGDI